MKVFMTRKTFFFKTYLMNLAYQDLEVFPLKFLQSCIVHLTVSEFKLSCYMNRVSQMYFF